MRNNLLHVRTTNTPRRQPYPNQEDREVPVTRREFEEQNARLRSLELQLLEQSASPISSSRKATTAKNKNLNVSVLFSIHNRKEINAH